VVPSPVRSADERRTSLTDWLRHRSDGQLTDLLRRRPDLALPAPHDLSTLASRISVRTSVLRAIDQLDAFALRILDAVVLATGPDGAAEQDRLAALTRGLDPDDVARALDQLAGLALAWFSGPDAHPVAAVAEVIGPYPAGLGRSAGELLRSVSDVTLAAMLQTLGLPPATQPASGAAVREVLTDPDRLARLLADRDADELQVLQRLAAGPPVGTVREVLVPSEAGAPPHRLLMHALLIPIDAQTVELPREVGLAVRGDRPLGAVSPVPPTVQTVQRTPAELDRLGTTAVLDSVRLIDALAQAWTHHPPAVLRGGGVGVRELRRLARELDVDEQLAALAVEVAAAAGLVAATHSTDPVFLPTSDYDTWSRRDAAEQWTTLATAWLSMTRQPNLISQRDERDRLITALGPDAERGTVPALRRQLFAELAELPPGTAPLDSAQVLERLAWRMPRRATAQRRTIAAVLSEAEQLGVTAASGLTGYSRALLGGSAIAAADALTIALPEPVDHFLLQPDLTLVVPGPPERQLAEELALTADLESTGGANVYRVTESSVRRALDSGRSGTDLAHLFAHRSRTPVPQALTYLVEDVARRHGLLRTGAATAYLRCDDESLLTRVVADRAVDGLDLRRLAPTVVIAQAPVTRILEVLREAGYAPSAEGSDGAVVALDAEPRRAPVRPGSRTPTLTRRGTSEEVLNDLVHRMRAGDQLAELTRRAIPVAQQVPGVTTAATLALLRDAIRGEATIWLGYVDSQGTASQRTINPISLGGGMLRGHDARTGKLESFSLHHITAVSVLESGQPD
jgi:hypothetical protein